MTVPKARTADLLILDCDGVLVDSEGPSCAVLSRFFTARGLPLAPGDIHAPFVGGTLRTAGDEAARRGATLEEGWFDVLRGEVFAALRGGVPLVPGVVDTTTNFVEHPEVVAQRLERFAGIVGSDRVIAGSDCGFGTFAGFGAVDPEIAYAKMTALSEGAKLANGRL